MSDMMIEDTIKDDWEEMISDELGVSITYTPVTTTQRGMDTVRTEGTAESRTVIIYLAGINYPGLTEGFFTDVDAVIIGKSSETWARDSKVVLGSYTYRVKNIADYLISSTGTSVAYKVDLVRI